MTISVSQYVTFVSIHGGRYLLVVSKGNPMKPSKKRLIPRVCVFNWSVETFGREGNSTGLCIDHS